MSAAVDVTKRSLLQRYLAELATNPLRTKMLTNMTLNGIQEVLASYLAGEKTADGSYVSDRVPKMMLYGLFISAPISHTLVTTLQKVFEGRTTPRDKVLQIIASNLIVSPIQNTAFLLTMAVIGGARTFDQAIAVWKAGFMKIMRISWISSPIAIAIAQKFLPPEAWVPFFNLIAFVFGTYVNQKTKKQMQQKRRLAK
ncbi:hypothetical protein PYCC9005_004742 [Savitreella phatthalungensis]